MGSLLGMYVAMNFIQAKLNPLDTASRADLTPAEFEAVKEYDLSVLIGPYLAIGLVILAMFVLILFWRMPKNGDKTITSTSCPRCAASSPCPITVRASSRSFLRGRADHVLDLHHPVWHTGAHGRWHG